MGREQYGLCSQVVFNYRVIYAGIISNLEIKSVVAIDRELLSKGGLLARV